MTAGGPHRSEDWIGRQAVGNGFSKPPGGVIGLGRISSGKIGSDAFANEPDCEVRQGRNFVRIEPSPAPAAIVGRIFESHAA
jgi:hypothetical protein